MHRIYDIDNNGSRNFIGRLNGVSMRDKLSLNKSDNNRDIVYIVFPEDTLCVTSSFMFGMFGDSLRKLGRDKFLSKYKISYPSHLENCTNEFIKRVTIIIRGDKNESR